MSSGKKLIGMRDIIKMKLQLGFYQWLKQKET